MNCHFPPRFGTVGSNKIYSPSAGFSGVAVVSAGFSAAGAQATRPEMIGKARRHRINSVRFIICQYARIYTKKCNYLKPNLGLNLLGSQEVS